MIAGADGHANYHYTKSHSGQHRYSLLDPGSSLHFTALTSAKREVQAIIGEWHDIVAHHRPILKLGTLSSPLFSTSNPEHPYALETACLAHAPIALFPRLRDCYVPLYKLPSYQLQQIAQDAVLQACGRASPT